MVSLQLFADTDKVGFLGSRCRDPSDVQEIADRAQQT